MILAPDPSPRCHAGSTRRWLAVLWPLALLAACQAPEPPAKPAAAPTLAKPAAPAPQPALPTDVNERGAGYDIGISYPPTLAAHPQLIPLLTTHANAIRRTFMDEGVARRDAATDEPTYSLSLQFTLAEVTPQVIAAGMDGDMFTGGAHGAPLVERWLWLSAENRVLPATDLFAAPQDWNTLATWVRDQLLARANDALDADAAAGAAADETNGGGSSPNADRLATRAAALSDSARWIDEGTAEGARSFALFEPVAGKGGRLSGLRFVFPPYQVGPYVDGVQEVQGPRRCCCRC